MDIRIIAPITRDCVIGDQTIQVRGISLRNCAALLVRFPAILSYMAGKAIDPVELLTTFPDASLAVMAAGLGKTGDAEVEKQLDDWNFGEQAAVLSDVIALTFSGEKALPFVQALVATASRSSNPETPSEPLPTQDETQASSTTTRD